MKILFGVLGLIFGAGLDDETGAFFGLAIGILAGALIQYRDKINHLEKSLGVLQTRVNLLQSETTVKKESVVEETTEPEIDVVDSGWDEQPKDILPDPNFVPANQITTKTEEANTIESSVKSSQDISLTDKVFSHIKEFFTTGNIVVKIAIIILFFGVSFLIKYASENNLLPIELRLLGVAVFGAVLLAIGWRLRLKNSLYALVVQGGAIGLLYLTTYSAGRYEIIPALLAFAILFFLVIFACFLAVKQESKSLAQFATIGGFLAPILTSTGSGSHVELFTYYAILNLGIFIVAWFKSWRSLNWIGFVFTFVIASLWGFKYYNAEYFNTTQPFLILFFVFYVAISILFSVRQPPKLKGIVDGSLVFGVPLVGFALQSRLVENFEYGHAWSAFIIGMGYFLLNRFINIKKVTNLNSLNEAFLALAIIFLTLTIPFTVDGNWTAAAWALEGAGILWMGLKQNQKLAKWFGLGLQIMAAIMFFIRNESTLSQEIFLDSFYIGSVMISIAALFSSYHYSIKEKELTNLELSLPKILFYWGLLWWLGIHLYKIDHLLTNDIGINILILFVTLSFLLLAFIGQSLNWKFPEKNAVIVLPVIILFTLVRYTDHYSLIPFDNYGWLSLPVCIATSYLFLYRNSLIWESNLVKIYHALSLYLIVFLLTWFIDGLCARIFTQYNLFSYLVWGIVPAICVLALINIRNVNLWPIKNYPNSYLSDGLIPVFGFLSIWCIAASSQISSTKLFAYLPIMNLQDISIFFVIAVMLYWIYLWSNEKLEKINFINKALAYLVIIFISFVWLNSMIAHSVHYYAGVDYNLLTMLGSDIYQSSVSIVWTLTAFIIMTFSSKQQLRKLWFVGATILGLVILKLFVIDMNDSGTLTRIVSFIGVAVLMLVLSYFSPTPPKLDKA